MLKKILIGLAGAVVLFVVVGFLLPTTYAIERSLDVQATPEEIHVFVDDLEKWPTWAPWEEDDPSIQTTLGPTTRGTGASQTWTSDSGDGELTITRSDPATGVTYDMAFIMGETRAPATCAMTYEVAGDGTKVVWTMEGDVRDFMPPVVAGYMNLLMKGQIGGMFDRGLEKLKTTVEAE